MSEALKVLQESNGLLPALIENLPGGAVFVVDRNLRYLLAQGEALSYAGFRPEDFVGRTIFEALPPELATEYETLYRQGLAGEPFEHEHSAHNRSFVSRGTPLWSPDGEVYAVLAVSYDITERKRHEANLAFLSEVSQDLARLTNIDATMNALGEKIGGHLDLSACAFAELDEAAEIGAINQSWHRSDVPSLVGTYRMQDFVTPEILQRCRAGEAVVVRNVFDDPLTDGEQYAALNIGSFLSIPLVRDGEWRFLLVIYHTEPYDWRDDEIELTHELANRIWTRLERARAEAALAASEEKYRTLFETMAEGFGFCELVRDETGQAIDWRFLELNPVLKRHTGLDRDASVRPLFSELFPSADRTYWLGIYQEVVDTQSSRRFENYWSPIDRWLAGTATPVGGENFNIFYEDVTERKRAEERQVFLLKLSDALRPLADPLVIQEVACRVLGEYLGANRVLYSEMAEGPGSQTLIRVSDYTAGVPSRVGWHRLDDYGKFVTETWRAGRNLLWSSLDDLPNLQADERAAYEAVEIEAIIGVPLVKEGRFEAFLAVHQATPRKWTADEIALAEETAERTWAAVERARAEESLRESEEKYRTLFNSINEGYALCEMLYDDNEAPINWRILEVNPAFESLSGLVDAAGKSTRELNQPLNANWLQTFGTVAQTGKAARFEQYFDGTEYWYEISVSRIDDDQRHIVVIFNDISDRKRAEAERIRLIEEQAAREEERQRVESLAELDRAKTLFFSNISHEFRTPLTLLLAPLQDALDDRTLDPIHRERLELARQNSLRLLKLVNTLLDFSRIEAGRIEAVYEPTDLAQLTTDLASVFRSAIERAGLRLIVDCPPLPEPVYVDRQMWEKIVLNLLSNALKFTFSGEIAVRLHPKDRNQVLLQIRDTGSGIAPEHLPHLFERFYQVRGVQARTHEGSGIGLALVYELTRLQGGAIAVSSTLGQGTCFTITLPFGTDHLPPERIQVTRTLTSTALGATPYVEEAERWLPTASAEVQVLGTEEESNEGSKLDYQTNANPQSSTPARVLIVDDNADMREYLTRILSEHVEVRAVADGTAALAAIQTQAPDLVLSDVMMPRLDGFGLLQTLRADPRTREVPIILLSARAGEEAIAEGLNAGADDYLIKPFSAQELISRVNAHLQLTSLRQEALHEARSTIRRKDELLSVVSHELNTPLVSILGWTRLLRANPPNPAMLSKALDTIERNATMQAKLVQDLLDVSRITAGKLHLHLQPIELESVIKAAIATVTQIAADAGIHLTWTETAAAVVMGDQERLGQVVCNLLTNAIKFTPNGGRVDVCLSFVTGDLSSIENEALTAHDQQQVNRDNYAEIRVTDTGIGIAADFLPHVFEQFRQEGKNSAKGLGLGLAIARHIVELHNGTLQAQSAGEGQGTTFIVRLPLFEGNP